MNRTLTTSAYDLLDAGKYEDAYSQLSKLADAGDGSANLHLGWMYQRGLGRQVDLAKAEQFYLRAAEGGVPEAPYYLGCLYRAAKRYPEALDRLEQAVSQGNPSAAYWAYVMYNDGEGIAQDSRKATQLLRKAAELGHVFARRDLAKRMIRGEFGLGKIPSGVWAWIANVFKTARFASLDPDDVRIR